MKVKDLIAALEKLDQLAEVVVNTPQGHQEPALSAPVTIARHAPRYRHKNDELYYLDRIGKSGHNISGTVWPQTEFVVLLDWKRS